MTYSEFNSQQIDSLKKIVGKSPADSVNIQALYDLNVLHRKELNYDSSIKYCSVQIQLGRQLDDGEAISWGYYDRASANWNKGNYDNALRDADSAQFYFSEIKDTTRIYNSVYLQGMIYGDKGDYENAMSAYYESIKGFERIDKKMNQGAVLNSVALVHQWMGDLESAETQFLNSITILDEVDAEERMAMSMSNLAYLYASTERYEEAMDLHRSSLSIHQKVGSEWGVASNNGNIGDLLNRMGRPNAALPYLQMNIDFQRKKGDPKELASTLMMRAEVYNTLEKYELAKMDLVEALELAKSSGTLDYNYQIERDLSDLAQLQGNFKEAHEALLRSTTLKDSLFAKEKIKAVTEASEKYETEKKETEINLLTAENAIKDAALENESNVKKGLIGGLVLLLTIGGLLVNGQRRKHRAQQLLAEKDKDIRQAEFDKDLQEIELKALRAQMNPHFIFNSMNSINRLILEDRNEEASRNLTKFSKLVRMILEFSERKTITLKEELEFLETYIQIESNRFKGKIAYQIDVSTDIDTEELTVPSMILQPFVENAIWHGLMHKEDGDGKIDITISEVDEMLKCSIEDNGVGRKKAAELKSNSSVIHKSMAMKVTEARLALLNKSGLGKLIDIIDLKNATGALGTRVKVSIPL